AYVGFVEKPVMVTVIRGASSPTDLASEPPLPEDAAAVDQVVVMHLAGAQERPTWRLHVVLLAFQEGQHPHAEAVMGRAGWPAPDGLPTAGLSGPNCRRRGRTPWRRRAADWA